MNKTILLYALLVFTPIANAQPDLGIAPNYSISFNKTYNYQKLKDMGVKRVNLYFTWKEFELGEDNPSDTNGTSIKEELDPLIDSLTKYNLKACIIIEPTDTDCGSGSPDTCWTKYGMEDKFTLPSFVGFDDPDLIADAKRFMAMLATRFSPNVVTHVFFGNETDNFLRNYPQYKQGYYTLHSAIQDTLNTLLNRASYGSIFTFTINNPDWNNIADSACSECEVLAFTIYPSLEASWADSMVVPVQNLIDTWFSIADSIAQKKSRRLVVTETGYPTAYPIGTQQYQEQYAKNLINYLNNNGSNIDFVSWYALWDAPNHPDAFFHSCGLLTYPEEAQKPSFPIWIAGTTGIASSVNGNAIYSEVFPNPAQENATLFFILTKQINAQLIITDMYGRDIQLSVYKSMMNGQNAIPLDLSELTGGVFYYRLQGNDISTSGRFLVIH